MVAGEKSTEELKRQHQALKTASVKSRMESIDSTLPSDLLRSVNQSRGKAASSWLTAVPLVDRYLVLNKQEFRDSLRLRYNVPLPDLPSKCVCGEKYTVCHALSCKKRGFSWRRDTMAFASYLPLFLVRLAPTLKSNHNYNLSIMSDSTSEARWQVRRQGWTSRQGAFGLEELQHFSMS